MSELSGSAKNTLVDYDVVIVGAGLSGIGMAYYLQRDCPTLSYTLIESRENLGGTWDLFKYPGIRSDSDLYTFGYEFKPWKSNKAIADGKSIRDYIDETARENDIKSKIQYQQKIKRADWDSATQTWTLTLVPSIAKGKKTPKEKTLTCRWFFSASGYYNYSEGFTPEFPGRDTFKGQVVHPQHWPEDLDYTGKKVVVIGSGATAVTLLPAMADKAKSVTMLQRTPTYIMSLPEQDPIANLLKLLLPAKTAYRLIRNKNIGIARAVWKFCQRFPKTARSLIRLSNKRLLPKGFPVDKHFNPPYDPWNQRLCAVPDGDLFKQIEDGKCHVVTDHIDAFTETGIALKSGDHLDADIIVTATGLNVQLFGGIEFKLDGKHVNLADTVAFRGMMLSGLPNFAFAIGYTNSSWTLKVGLICEHLCRLINYADAHGFGVVEAKLPKTPMPLRPLLDFEAGYIKRVIDQLPKQGDKSPWYMAMDYKVDYENLRKGPLLDSNLSFQKRTETTAEGQDQALQKKAS